MLKARRAIGGPSAFGTRVFRGLSLCGLAVHLQFIHYGFAASIIAGPRSETLRVVAVRVEARAAH